LDLDVDKAYRRGKEESQKQYSQDMISLNTSLEVKEIRITEMLVSISFMEKRVKDAEESSKRVIEEGRVARLEAIETIATFGGGGGGGGTSSERELEAARDSLDTAQEEVVLLSEKCDGLTASLLIAKQKCELFEQLVQAAQSSARAAAANAVAAQAAGGSGGSGVVELLSMLKADLVKGSALWKNNRKDECFDLYVHTCEAALLKLHSPG
jgi:hypothetical protein